MCTQLRNFLTGDKGAPEVLGEASSAGGGREGSVCSLTASLGRRSGSSGLFLPSGSSSAGSVSKATGAAGPGEPSQGCLGVTGVSSCRAELGEGGPTHGFISWPCPVSLLSPPGLALSPWGTARGCSALGLPLGSWAVP